VVIVAVTIEPVAIAVAALVQVTAMSNSGSDSMSSISIIDETFRLISFSAKFNFEHAEF
jgi:hypothetical protein